MISVNKWFLQLHWLSSKSHTEYMSKYWHNRQHLQAAILFIFSSETQRAWCRHQLMSSFDEFISNEFFSSSSPRQVYTPPVISQNNFKWRLEERILDSGLLFIQIKVAWKVYSLRNVYLVNHWVIFGFIHKHSRTVDDMSILNKT